MKKIIVTLVLAASPAFAGYVYTCEPLGDTDYPETYVLDIEPNDLIFINAKTGVEINAKRDQTNKPKGSPNVRYVGSQYVERIDVIASARLIEGAKSGYLQVRGYADGGYTSENYVCSNPQSSWPSE